MGGIEDVLQAMRTHPSDLEVQSLACGALWNLALNVDNKVKIGALGGNDDVLKAMRRHAADPEVQRRSGGALWILAANADNEISIDTFGWH